MSSTILVSRALNLPAEEVGRSLAEIPEDQWFDRKSSRIHPRDLADFLIGFANADGGLVAVGLSGGTIEGTDRDPSHRNALMQAAIDYSQPPVRTHVTLLPCVRGDGSPDQLLLLEVVPGEGVHANARDQVFLRIGDENRKLTFAQRQELLFDRGQATFESRPVLAAGLEVLADEPVNAYMAGLRAPDRERMLHARGLAVDGSLTVAGVILFAENPQQFLPEAFIRVLRYRGRERGSGARQQLLVDQHLEGPLPHQLVDAQMTIRTHQPVRRALSASGRFEDIPLVPEDAWLEGVVNAAVHRSYSLAGDHIRVEIFDDRIEIESPGRFPGLVNPSDPLNAPRFARNPRIARVCADQSFGQELGEGIRRMFDEMRLAGLGDPLYTQTQASVRLVLSGDPRDRELDARLPRETRTILASLRDGGRLSTGEVAEVLGVSRVTAAKKLQALRKAHLVVWRGKSPQDPRASWELPPT